MKTRFFLTTNLITFFQKFVCAGHEEQQSGGEKRLLNDDFEIFLTCAIKHKLLDFRYLSKFVYFESGSNKIPLSLLTVPFNRQNFDSKSLKKPISQFKNAFEGANEKKIMKGNYFENILGSVLFPLSARNFWAASYGIHVLFYESYEIINSKKAFKPHDGSTKPGYPTFFRSFKCDLKDVKDVLFVKFDKDFSVSMLFCLKEIKKNKKNYVFMAKSDYQESLEDIKKGLNFINNNANEYGYFCVCSFVTFASASDRSPVQIFAQYTSSSTFPIQEIDDHGKSVDSAFILLQSVD